MTRLIGLHLSRIAAAAICTVAAVNAHAVAPQQSNVSAPGGFVSACASSNSGAGVVPGGDLTALFGAGNCQSSFFSGNSSASASASYSGVSTANQAQGSTGLGSIHMSASNNGPNSGFFPAAGANGGWTETFTVNAPGKTGQAGIFLAAVNVNGTLAAHGFAGAAAFEITAYKDKGELSNSVFGFNDGAQSDAISTDRQRVQWSVATYGPPWNDASATINDTVHFAVPIVFGTSFSLGVYGYAVAGMRSSGGVPGNSTAELDFSHTLLWGGVAGVYDNGNNLITGYTLDSASGINWVNALPVPEPATYAMLLAGLGVLGVAARRRKQCA